MVGDDETLKDRVTGAVSPPPSRANVAAVAGSATRLRIAMRTATSKASHYHLATPRATKVVSTANTVRDTVMLTVLTKNPTTWTTATTPVNMPARLQSLGPSLRALAVVAV